MALYGILKSSGNTGLDSEISQIFSTPLSIVSNQPVFKSELASLKQIVISQGTQRWEIEATLAQTSKPSNGLVQTVKYGHNRLVYCRMPQVFRVSDLAPDGLNLVLSAQANKGDTVISINGNSGNRIPEGEFIQIGTDPKVYLVVSIQSGGAALEVFPPLLRTSVATSVVNYGVKTTMTCRFDENMQLGIRYANGILIDAGTIRVVEAL